MHGLIPFYSHKHGIAIKEPLIAAYGYVVFKLLLCFSASWGGGRLSFEKQMRVDALFVEAIGASHPGATERSSLLPKCFHSLL